MPRLPFTAPTIQRARRIAETAPPAECDPRVEALVNELIGRVADKWTMIALEVLAEHGEMRFTGLSRAMPGISQKMLTQTLRGMERDGMVTRTVHAVVPPRVDYRLTELGAGLGAAFCGVWLWAEENLARVEASRAAFDARAARPAPAAAGQPPHRGAQTARRTPIAVTSP
ncbi:transcriptional regulator [Roseomonas nepalensis]|uniref:Transcriptional regulator n=1 Tax=Muricoccus nepalensis TaxID=1854500 RepID=A0A502GAJ6_9PROT|nr:helix-turn-helix domain-containing protein [Roseomonas nepalensis]TPG59005.1 transcriptional regulator [Roseomonas nepalensis]